MKSAAEGGGGSSVATTGVTKVGGSTQFTSLAVPDTFKPSAPAAVSPSAAPTSFVGPIPSTATRTATGYTTSSGTTVTPNPTPAWSGSATAADNNASKLNTSILSSTPSSASSTVTSYSPATTSSGTVSKTTAAQRAASSQQFKGFLGELTGLPSAKRLATGNSPRIGASVLPGAAAKAIGVGLDVASALPVVGTVGKGLAALGAFGKTAKAVGAADAALKGGKMLKDAAGPQAAALITAASIAAGPVGHVAPAAKAGTAITQSVNAAKKVTSAADTFVPTAAKASSKGTSSVAKSVESVPKKAPATTEFSAATKAKTVDAVAKAKTASSVVTASKAGTSTNTAVKAQDATKATADYQAPSKVNDSRANQFKFEINKPSGTEGKTTFKGIDTKEFKDPTNTKNPDVIKHKGQAPDEAAYNAQDIINDVKPFQAVVKAGGSGTEGPTPPEAPKKPTKPKKPRRIPNIKVKTDGRQWRPSSIV
jgi:hypothetical protein